MQGDARGETFKTLGLEIKFPFQPYGVQKSMINHITRTLSNKQNSLIESPTGTGKTLVLLCSTLAWLKKSRELERPFISARILEQIGKERIENLANSKCYCGRRENKADACDGKEKEKGGKGCKGLPEEDSEDCCQYFEESSKYFSSAGKDRINTYHYPDENGSPPIIIDEKPSVEIIDLTLADKDEKPASENKPKPLCKNCQALTTEKEFSKIITEKEGFIPNHYKKIPKIYYGTRTHKQVSQVIRELNKTDYNKNLRMCILSSRERTCINELVRIQPNRDEECRELLKSRNKNDGRGCIHKIDNLESTFEMINDSFIDQAWDIEDLNKWSKEKHACPYFGCRSLQDKADITFCPYNYLLDPKIRRSLKINLKNSVIIFDEAHNLEDICRDSASFILSSKQIDDILAAINVASSHFVQGSNMADAYQFFRDKFYNLRHYLQNFEFGQQTESSKDFVARKVLSQSEMLDDLVKRGLGPDCLANMAKNLSILRDDDNSGNTQESNLDMSEVQYIAQLAATLEFMYSNNNKNVDDYRCVITKSLIVEKARKSKKDRSFSDPESLDSNYITTMSLLCMSPAIAFKKIHSEAWSVIVASGTLSPIESIQTELGCEFVTPFQGSHVIPPDRVIATVLNRGPNGADLNCSFTNSMSLKFQDEVGAVVRDVCMTVPNGVLCFFPSYDRLEGLHQRWMTKGYMKDIQGAGVGVFKEQKQKSPEEFESTLQKYNAKAKTRGALLLAVYRGKVSEGIDFADKAARAVITIGVPYPNVKEITVGLKRDYNDIARRTKPHLLPGRDWYASQAFRALNQAVGRCIRHRDDWGAIIMIDSRLRIGNSVDLKISKWLRQLVFLDNDYRVVKDRLEEFIAGRLKEEESGKNKKIKLESLTGIDSF